MTKAERLVSDVVYYVSMRRVLAVAGVFAVLFPIVAIGAETPREVPVFPNLAFAAIDGSSQIDLESLRGRPVLMTFWASWCGPCRQELPEFEKLTHELADEELALITVNTDQDPNRGLHFLKQYGIDVPVYRMSSRVLAELGVESLPTSVLLDREGRPVAIRRGYSPALPDEIRRMVSEMEGGPDKKSEPSGQ